MKITKKILWGVLAILLVMQFFHPAYNTGEIYTETHLKNVISLPDSVDEILKTACYDCHSNHTIYPWYANIQPIGWWLDKHVREGKDEFNFSEFKNYKIRRQLKKLKQTAELVEKREMPLESYTYIHKDAILNPTEVQLLINWAEVSREALIKDSLEKVSPLK